MLNAALIGNPNTGKTTLFNALTDSYEYVGNWSGVTVEKKVGVFSNKSGWLTDLPGIYSLSPLSKDEGVTTQFLMENNYELMLNVVDASQLRRNLHLTIQLMEIGKPLVVALNMVDVARGRGMRIDVEKLSGLLHVAIVPVVARTGIGCDKLAQIITAKARVDEPKVPFRLQYGDAMERAAAELAAKLPADVAHKRWLALQFFEENSVVTTMLESYIDKQWLHDWYQQKERAILRNSGSKTIRHYMQQRRSETIDNLLASCIHMDKKVITPFSERVDQVVTNKFLGIPIFLLTMYLTFKLTFDWLGGPLSDLLGVFINGYLTDWLKAFLQNVGAAEALQALILNGIVAGVGGVLVFVPQIFTLFLIISFIEDSGYMARVATVMDKMMERVGLNGKTFIPMIIGFGCNVPGIMSARTIEQPKERLLTILLTPLMSCSARLTVYSLFVGAFFAENEALIVLSLYILGIVVALGLAKIFSLTIVRNEKSIFVVELPPYRLPNWRTLIRSTWEKGKGFVRKAGTFIFGGSVLIWVLSYTGPGGWDVAIDQSFLHLIGSMLAPLLAPLGFGYWQAGASLVSGFFAKEVVVSTMNIIYAVPGKEQLQGMLLNFFTPLQALCFMVFVLLYVPCLATVGTIRKELSSRKWTWFSVIYSLAIAYLVTYLVAKIGIWLGYI